MDTLPNEKMFKEKSGLDKLNPNYQYVYPQTWLHARHQETQRLTFTNIYSLIITGLMVYLGTIENKISEVQIVLLFLLIVLSIFGLYLTDAWNKSFVYYRELIRGITILWQIPPEPDYHKSRVPAWKMFLLFYSLTSSFFIGLFIIETVRYFGFNISLFFGIPFTVILTIILFFERERSSDKFFNEIKKNIKDSLKY